MKTMMKLLLIAVVPSLSAMAQNEVDALRYSQTTIGGTARYVSMAGAFGALGGDFSTLSTNPASIGIYKKSEFTFSPSIFFGATSSLYNNESREDYKYNFNLGNLGLVTVLYNRRLVKDDKSEKKPAGWLNCQFGFGINRINNFNNRVLIEGPSKTSSLLHNYLDYAQGIVPGDLNSFDAGIAYDTYLLDTLGSATNYICAVPDGGVLQRKSITTSGSMNEFVMTFGGNYSEKLYIGGTIGVPYIRYIEESEYVEKDKGDTINNFKEFTLNQYLSTYGEGINFKFGLIYRVTDFLRLGAAVHTPTFFKMEDNWHSSISSSFDNGNSYTSYSPNGKYDYHLETPFKAIGSIGFVIGKIGLLSADYEYVDYSQARLRAGDYSFIDENDAVQSKYTATSNLRVGGEVRLEPISLRAGYALYGSPYRSGINDAQATSLSFGIGIRDKDYFFDLAYVHTQYSEDYYLYNPDYVNAVKNTLTKQTFIATLGFKF